MGDAEDAVEDLVVRWTLDDDLPLAGPLSPGADGLSTTSTTLALGSHRLRDIPEPVELK